jgi:signal transduction histidine kinase
LRAPLRTIQGYAQAVIEDYGDKLDDEGKRLLERIAAASRRMDRLTQDVLTYSRVGRSTMKIEPISLAALVPETLQQYLPSSAREAISVQQPLLPVLGSEPLLAQVIANLAGNALKFVPRERTPRVHISTERRGANVRLWVVDNGIGIPPEQQARIWGLFERIWPAGMYEGTGIGLTIVRRAIERMGGTVGVESDGTQGSRFWVELPSPA